MLVMEETYLTAEEVAQKLRLSLDTTLRLLRRKELPGYKIGGSWRIGLSELEKYLEDQKKK